MQMGKEQKNFLLPDEHIYHPLMRNSITVNAISPLVIFGLQAGFAVYYIIVFRKSPYQKECQYWLHHWFHYSLVPLLVWLAWSASQAVQETTPRHLTGGHHLLWPQL